jgi:hypothetical protein
MRSFSLSFDRSYEAQDVIQFWDEWPNAYIAGLQSTNPTHGFIPIVNMLETSAIILFRNDNCVLADRDFCEHTKVANTDFGLLTNVLYHYCRIG